MLLQFSPFFSSTDALGQPTNGVPDFLVVVLIAAGVALLLFLIGALVLHTLRQAAQRSAALQKTILLVTLPKESSEVSDEQETIELVRGQVAIAESWLATLGGMRAQRGVQSWLLGRNDHFSLEMVVTGGLISFYIVVPDYLRQYMEQQIIAQYPEAHIEAVEDFNIFSPTSEVASAYVTFTSDYVLPISTYRRLNVDPLNAIVNSLSKVTEPDGAMIQIIARSAKREWHNRGTSAARIMQREGVSLKQAIAKLSGTFSIFNLLSSGGSTQHDKQQHAPSPMEQEQIKGIEEKTAKAGLDCNIRVVVSAQNQSIADAHLRNILESFSQYNFYQYGNSFKAVVTKPNNLVPDMIERRYLDRQKVLLNTEELASLFHLPTPFLETPNIRWLRAKKLAAPTHAPTEGLLLGENIHHNVQTNIYLQTNDRRRHMYMVGMTGTGKSVMMANLAIQDIRNGKGVCVIDPHGSLVEEIIGTIPEERMNDVIYFNPADTERPIGLNMLEAHSPEQQDFVIQEMISIFYKLVTDPSMIGPMFEHNMRNAMLTLMADTQYPGTIVEIPRIFTDKEFQKYKIAKVTDPMVRSFWEQEMAKTSDFHKSEMLGYLISKVGRFIENAMMRNIIGQPKSGFNFRDVMDKQKILLVNLSKGQVGDINSGLLGLIIVAKLQMAALSRTDIAEEQRKDFYLYIDEFQNFITDSVATILAEARKYKLNLILAHQYLGQLTEGVGVEGKTFGEKIKNSVFGNVGTMVSFRVGPEDAEFLAKQFNPTVNAYDLMNIEKYNAYVRLLIDNQPARPCNMRTFQPVASSREVAEHIKDLSRWRYGSDRVKVESEIMVRSRLGLAKAETIAPPLETAR